MKFIEDMSLEERNLYLEQRRKRIEKEQQANDRVGLGNETRYRCEQINVIKLDGIVSAYSTVQLEYILSFIDNTNAIVTLVDSIYNLDRPETEELVAFIRKTDQIKHKIHYELDDRGWIKNIRNRDELKHRWDDYVNHFDEDPYIAKLDQKSREEMIKVGNHEFALSGDLLLKNSYSNLFNRIIFGQYLEYDFKDFRDERISTQSHFFPDIEFSLNCKTKRITEDLNSARYIKQGLPLLTDNQDISRLYDKFYKQQLQFQYTDYLYDFSIDYEVSKKENRITKANVNINEAIKNNMESQVSYKVRRVDL